MRTLLFLLSLTFLFSCESNPCGDKDQLQSNLDYLLQETKTQIKNADNADWSKLEDRFKTLTDQCYKQYKDEMTVKERRLFWKDAMHVLILQGGENLNFEVDTDATDNKFKIDTDNPEWAYIESEIEEVFKGTGEELKIIIDDFLKNDASELIDKAMQGIEKFAEELKEALKESNNK